MNPKRYVRIAFNIEPLHPDLVLLQEVWTKSAAAVPPTNIGWLIARAPSANFFRRNGLWAHEFRDAVGCADLPISCFQRRHEVVTFEAS